MAITRFCNSSESSVQLGKLGEPGAAFLAEAAAGAPDAAAAAAAAAGRARAGRGAAGALDAPEAEDGVLSSSIFPLPLSYRSPLSLPFRRLLWSFCPQRRRVFLHTELYIVATPPSRMGPFLSTRYLNSSES